jgi:cytidylate kinase
VAASLQIRFEESFGGPQRVFVGGRDVTADIRTPEVTRVVSPVSAHAPVRSAMVRLQRSLAGEGGAVLEGRDIGTVVVPGAEVKIFLVASTRLRAERRLREMRARGIDAAIEEVERDIVRRDAYDSERASSPLRRAIGSVEVDTSALTIDGQVERVIDIARSTATRLSAMAPVAQPNAYGRFRPWYRFARCAVQMLLRMLFGVEVRRMFKVDFNENYIYACNHVSYADPPFVAATLPREVFFVAKASLFRNRLIGKFLGTLNAIPIRRGMFDRGCMRKSLDLLSRGRSLLIFPEGGRISGGELGPPKSGVGFLALHSGVAVVPLYVSGTDRLWRCLLRRERLTVSYGRPIRIAPGTAAEFGDAESARAFSEMVMEGIRALKDEFGAGRAA